MIKYHIISTYSFQFFDMNDFWRYLSRSKCLKQVNKYNKYFVANFFFQDYDHDDFTRPGRGNLGWSNFRVPSSKARRKPKGHRDRDFCRGFVFCVFFLASQGVQDLFASTVVLNIISTGTCSLKVIFFMLERLYIHE